MKDDTNNKQSVLYSAKSLFVILGITLAIHIISFVLSKGALAEFRWQHLPIHSSIEMLGAAIAFWVAWTLISVNKNSEGTSFNLRIACALFAMGLFDAFHAVWYVGNEFVWLHSLATFFGGLVFASIWIESGDRENNKGLVTICCLALISIAVWPYLAPETVPKMTESGHFSLMAKALNITGGIFFLIAAIKLFLCYRATQKTDDFLFFIHCVLFGCAAIMFEQSKLWDFAWWGWHLLRLMAYAVALAFIIQTEMRIQKKFIDQLETKVRERTNEIAQANKRLERFASMASHDLKEPLRMISSFSEILDTNLKGTLDSDNQRYLNFIKDSSNHGLSLVDDILNLSRISNTSFDIESVPFGGIIEQVKKSNAKLFKEKNAVIDLRDDLPDLCGNASQLYQICTNIINNGIKYNESKQPTVTIFITEKPTHWEVAFVDNGIGIEEAHFDKIFQEFSRLHGKDKYQGTGLGLTTCMEIAKQNKGELKVESQLGVGSTFTLSWPKLS